MANNSPTWESIQEGTKLTELIKEPDYKHVFMFSAITWNRHMIHYNSKQAQKEGLPDVVVQRALIGNYLAQLITQWAGERAELCRLEWKVVRSAVPGDKLTCIGEIVEKIERDSKRLAISKIQVINQNTEIVAAGQAHIRFF